MADEQPVRAPDVRPGTPRWVKVLGVGIVVVVLVVVGMLVVGGDHGPRVHGGSAGGDAPTVTPSGTPAVGDVGGPVAATQAARTVEVRTLDTMAFEPSTMEVSDGQDHRPLTSDPPA